MKIVFMGTPHFAVPTFKALCESEHDIVAVYTQPPRPAGRGQKETPSPVHQYALEKNIPVYTPASLKDEATQKIFRAHKADIAVVAAYGLLLPPLILTAYPLGCINVHPSLLPRWRGAAPIQRTIMAGDKETGICIMQMEIGLDTGDILYQQNEFIPDSMNAGELHDMLAQQAGPMVLLVLEGLKNKTITPRPQSSEGVTYAQKITKEECRIDWNQDATAIENIIRGLAPTPGAYCIYKGEKLKILDASASKMDLIKKGNLDPATRPGTVISHSLDVACGKGILSLEKLQRPGKTALYSQEFLKGAPIPLGSILE